MMRAPSAVEAAERSAAPQALRTEFRFELPHGYIDDAGAIHRQGTMRLATGRDEIMPLRDTSLKSTVPVMMSGL